MYLPLFHLCLWPTAEGTLNLCSSCSLVASWIPLIYISIYVFVRLHRSLYAAEPVASLVIFCNNFHRINVNFHRVPIQDRD